MTTGAEHVVPQTIIISAVQRRAAFASTASGVAGALANALLVAYLALDFARPGAAQATLGLAACLLAAVSSVLLAPVALVLGGVRLATLGAATTACLTLTWLLLAVGTFTPPVGAHIVAGGALALAAWLVLVCRRHTVPPRASRFGRRAGIAALVGTLIVVVNDAVLPAGSMTWIAVLIIGGVPAAVGWFGVPAWSLRMGRWLRVTDGSDPARP
ncbi:MAG: hypothetical protein QOI16_2142 [Pseudonocardiales bacterium]|nr:hypothetical protein [Pseudonocardiales bacterium]